MRLCIASACRALLLVPLSIVAAENPTGDGVVHGTINIALGNKNGLVVLTDSMVTATDATGTHQLSNPGQKLFKLDDRTVCSVAGFASAPAGSTRVTVSDLNTSTSAIIHEYVRQSTPQPRQSIAEKLRALASIFKMHLAMIANVRDAAGNPTPIDTYRFQLIVAGYDIDDKPKIGRIALRMKNSTGSLISEIEDVSLLNVEEELVSQLNGMPNVAAQILLHPESEPRDAAIRLYATSLAENGGRSLTLEQMVELAKRLAYYTSKAHSEVGGPNQVAIFKKSETVSINQPNFPEPPRPLFRFSLIVDSHFSYSSVVFAKGSPAVFVRCSWVGMQHDLDGHYYIGSEFRNSVLMYNGGDVNLGDTNRVTDSVLVLGPHAILENEVVRHLTAAFSSLRVAYAVSNPKPWQVVP
jgi:20S proteasome alpha/beta subunit